MESQKQRNFIAEPMANKSVKELPGVGPTLGTRFENAGYSKVIVNILLFIWLSC